VLEADEVAAAEVAPAADDARADTLSAGCVAEPDKDTSSSD